MLLIVVEAIDVNVHLFTIGQHVEDVADVEEVADVADVECKNDLSDLSQIRVRQVVLVTTLSVDAHNVGLMTFGKCIPATTTASAKHCLHYCPCLSSQC